MENLVIYQKVYDLMIYLFPIIDRFPKYEKFVLCTQVKNCIIDIARRIIRANKSRSKRPLANMLAEHDADGKHTFASSSVADEGSVTLDTGKIGRGWAMAGDNEEYIEFRFTAAGVVTVISNTANAINTDTDGNLCVYDAGAGIAIKNRLGATKIIRYVVQYSA